MMDLVNRISDDVIGALAAAGWPPLHNLVDGSPGRIIVLNKHKLDQFMPPRIVFLPKASTFGVKDMSRGAAPKAGNASGYDAESKVAISLRAIATEMINFEVRCWGIASDDAADPYGADFEYTQALYHQVIMSCQGLMPGCFKLTPGTWNDVAHLTRVGREFVFELAVSIPVLVRLGKPSAFGSGGGAGRAGLPLATDAGGKQSAPPGVAPAVTDQMTDTGGNSSPGCE